MKEYTKEDAEKILEAIKREYGFIPLVNEVLSERPDLFIPSVSLTKAVLEGDNSIGRKTSYLCAIAAATALGGEHCINVQTKHAIAAGASKDEVMEAMMIGSVMAMTRSQSYAFRKLKENWPD